MSKLDDGIAALTAKVQHETEVDDSVKTFIQGIPALIKTAVDQAIGAGATAAQLQSITDLGTTILADADGLTNAVVANTPAAA